MKMLKWVDEDSVFELLAQDGAAEAVTSMFEATGSRSGFFIITAENGDTFETDGEQIIEESDDDEEDGQKEAKFQKLRHQRLRWSHTFLRSDSSATTHTRCVFLVKVSSEAIAAADAKADSALLDSSFEVVFTDVPSLLSLHALLMNAYLPMIEDVPTKTNMPLDLGYDDFGDAAEGEADTHTASAGADADRAVEAGAAAS